IVFRHSSIYGGRQFSTCDQGWIGWFVNQAINIERGDLKGPFSISGTGRQVRDVLYSTDLIDCYFKAVDNVDRCCGEVFNIGGGAENSLSLLELFEILESELGIKMDYKELPCRKSDQKVFIADITKAHEYYGWRPAVDKITGIRNMIDWVRNIV
ncbi:MAG: NAD-dependent epimerase/dehydratase family protein, partial [Bacteriovoracaceae bacterium]|nr:NAD-dependent epimerase/dehydratase family protein [Bacteriovoracaceae bacterium]